MHATPDRRENDADFAHCRLPKLGKRVLRLGVATNYGLSEPDVEAAALRGVNFWLWSPRFKTATPVLKRLLAKDRERHVVAMLDNAYTGGMVRRGIEKGLRMLGVDQLDLYLLGWLGKGSALTAGIQETLTRLRHEGKVVGVGTSIHDRRRAGKLAEDSILDAFMIRYNAKHPGAEQDIFPHLGPRDPVVVAYTATSWRQLIKPIPGISMPPWPGASATHSPPPLSAELCYRFCLSSPHVHVTLTGPKNREQLMQNLNALEHGPLTVEEMQWVRAYGREVKARKRLPFI